MTTAALVFMSIAVTTLGVSSDFFLRQFCRYKWLHLVMVLEDLSDMGTPGNMSLILYKLPGTHGPTLVTPFKDLPPNTID